MLPIRLCGGDGQLRIVMFCFCPVANLGRNGWGFSLQRRSAGVEAGLAARNNPMNQPLAAHRSQTPVPRCHVCSCVWTASRLHLPAPAPALAFAFCRVRFVQLVQRRPSNTPGPPAASHRIVSWSPKSYLDTTGTGSSIPNCTAAPARSLRSSQSCQQPLPSLPRGTIRQEVPNLTAPCCHASHLEFSRGGLE